MRGSLLITLLVLSVCLTPPSSWGGEIIRFPDDPSGGNAPILAPSGTDIRFVISGNRSEGYFWNGSSSQEMVVSPVPSGNRYVPEGPDGKGGGKFHLLFRAGMPGRSVVTLQYGREGSEPIRIHRIDVTVPSVPDPDTLFRAIDRSADGTISREEFSASSTIPLKTDSRGNFTIPLQISDTNGDGSVSLNELKDTAFRWIDRDGSGAISRDEFMTQLGTAFIPFVP